MQAEKTIVLLRSRVPGWHVLAEVSLEEQHRGFSEPQLVPPSPEKEGMVEHTCTWVLGAACKAVLSFHPPVSPWTC